MAPAATRSCVSGRCPAAESPMRSLPLIAGGPAAGQSGRRTCWLLSESSLAWGTEEDPQQLKHLVVFENGRLSHRSGLQIGQSPPVPPGYHHSWIDRRNSLDLATYDRMRVVTTELRRLLDKDRNILLRLGPKVRLSSSDLQKALQQA